MYKTVRWQELEPTLLVLQSTAVFGTPLQLDMKTCIAWFLFYSLTTESFSQQMIDIESLHRVVHFDISDWSYKVIILACMNALHCSSTYQILYLHSK